MRKILLPLLIFFAADIHAQADNEIQVYASPTIRNKWTMFELHSNYSTRINLRTGPNRAHWLNETLEITHGFGKNFEIGFYTFTAFDQTGKFQYLGNQIRPRITVPVEKNWPVGASLSMEIGYVRENWLAAFQWQGELRPIIDKTIHNWYFSFNPNLEFVLSKASKDVAITPQVKSVYTIQNVFGFGFEYYGTLGAFRDFGIWSQEHLLGPAIDLYLHPDYEINTGFLFGLTNNSTPYVIKLILGRRIGK